MNEQKNCQDCFQKDECQAVYGRLGNSDCPSIVRKVILAFLMPIIVFIASLFVAEKYMFSEESSLLNILHESIPVDKHKLQIFVCFICALLVTGIYLLVIRFLLKKHKKFM